MKRRINGPQLTYTLLALFASLAMKVVEVKPNRIASGEKFTAYEFLGTPALVLAAGFLFMAVLAYAPSRRKSLMTVITGALLFAFFMLLLGMEGQIRAMESPSIRVTLSMGFYVILLMTYLVFSHGLAVKDKEAGIMKAVMLGMLLFLVLLVSLGRFDAFSILKEYGIKRNQFLGSLRTHLVLSLGSVAAGSIMAIPLGYLAYRRKNLERVVMVPLSIVETIPSLSLFGILLVPLAGLGRIGFFRALGISGIGWAPAFVALTLYTLLPIGRNTLVGFSSVDRDVIEAAEGMGMNSGQIIRKIEFPLALPIIVTGVRIALVQTLGGAVLAGLVGGGGLGTFVFLGLAEGSPDLVLLGVIPIVIMTLFMDGLLKTVIEKIRRKKK